MRTKLSRRHFLRASALAAGSLLLGCGGGGQRTSTPTTTSSAPTTPGASPTPPEVGQAPIATPQPSGLPQSISRATPESYAGEYHEAPMLAELVKAGKLPPVEQRLPKHPYVVPHKWVQQGKYGGRLEMSYSDQEGISTFMQECMYGHSPLRWLEDGTKVGPGLVEAWESNDDASRWTLHFREGIKWSDGKPFTVDDVLFWWEDMVLNEEHPALPPDECRSGKGTLAKFKKVDDYTLMVEFDAPQPIFPELLCKYVKRGQGGDWLQPKHYLKQFHPRYNPKVGKNWVMEFDEKKDFTRNPDCPALTGWVLAEIKPLDHTLWVRNPYYWCVDRWGNQLPYIDSVRLTYVQDPQVLRLRYMQGKADYVLSIFTDLTLADVSGFKQAEDKSGMEVRFWDSGSGTGSIFFFNFDYKNKAYRDLIRNTKFRKALSHAFNRQAVQKLVYYQTGELTTGTYSPKTLELRAGSGARQVYQQWRDSAIKYDPELAKQLLDEIGVVDKDGDGWRELPDGGKLLITLDYGAPGGPEHVQKNELLSKDWKAIGINARPNPVPPNSIADRWAAGQQFSRADWEVGDSMSIWVSPQWLFPIESTKWAPLHGSWWMVRGTPEEKRQTSLDPWRRTPPRIGPEDEAFFEPIGRMWQIYDRARVEVDPVKRGRMAWDAIKIHIEEGPFIMGCVANYPRIVLVKRGLMNVPRREDLTLHGFTNPWHHPTPAVYDPETWYWDNPQEHQP